MCSIFVQEECTKLLRVYSEEEYRKLPRNFGNYMYFIRLRNTQVMNLHSINGWESKQGPTGNCNITLAHLHLSTFCHLPKFYIFCMFVSFVHWSKDLKYWYLFFCLLLHLCTPASGCWFGQHLTETDEWKFTGASVISCEGLTACAGGWWRVVEGV